MLSVIIPTLQKDIFVLEKLLTTLSCDSAVEEIILIDNSLKGFSTSINKVRVHTPSCNLFVNPSWNLGVKLAKSEYIALFNDDVVIPENFCSSIYEKLSVEAGIYGICEHNIQNIVMEEVDKTLLNTEINITKAEKRNNYYGIVMFFHKSAFYPIPEKIKVWCGDDYLFMQNVKNGRQNYKICGQNILHLTSMSSGCSQFDKIKQNDLIEYSKYDNKFINHNLINKNTFLQTIFSLRNAGPYKILTIMALQFKFKRRISA